MMCRRLAVGLSVAIGVSALATALPGSGRSGVRASGQLAFFAGLASEINSQSRPVVRPRVVYLRFDGSIVVTRLRWKSWGGSVARATGLYSASNCNPSCATGHRTNKEARVALSSAGRVLGHNVYRCFQLTVPNHPIVGGGVRDCIKHSSVGWVYEPTAPPPGSPLHLSSFLSPDGKIWCRVDQTEAFCGFGRPSNQPGVQYSATLHSNGQLVTCASQPTQNQFDACLQNWDASAHLLKNGQVDAIYQYRCRAAATSITCTVVTGTGKGKGFAISQGGVTPIP